MQDTKETIFACLTLLPGSAVFLLLIKAHIKLMSSELRVDFSVSSKWFESLELHTGGKWKTGTQSFAISFAKDRASRRLRFLASVVANCRLEVAVRFCDAQEMQDTNMRFRGKNKPTDVLSFPPSTQLIEDSRHLGDILICLPVCLCQAAEARVSFSSEVERMLVHGIVHLLGYDHERSEAAWRVQNSLEKILRQEIVKACGKSDWCEVKAWK